MGTLENVLRLLVEPLALAADFVGAATITIAVGYALLPYIRALRPDIPAPALPEVRRRLGRGLVLGLEFLIGADVLRTILQPSLQEVAVLGGIILLRTVLALSLDFELRGWERAQPQPAAVVGEQGKSRAA
ncbi:MAG: DUF1622 domain-containing protein [Chloroflexi bacterium]|nr:DUF1622 domain-containing protein [Chloroflexota bacterium]